MGIWRQSHTWKIYAVCIVSKIYDIVLCGYMEFWSVGRYDFLLWKY